jgi:predicted NAD/FAD-binding protein
MAKIAIVGGGISGMTAAWMLHGRHDITLFDANDYLGGHTHTHSLEADGQRWLVDSGFIVFNDKTYPNFRKLLKLLDVGARATTMSFSVKSPRDRLEYNGTSINSLFAQRRNVFRPKFWRMIKGILAFNDECKRLLKFDPTDESLGAFVRRMGFPEELAKYYIKPMTAAVWSCGTKQVEDMPIHFLARFFENHGFLNIDDRPQWYTVMGGSQAYANKIAARLGSSVRLKSPVISVSRLPSGVEVKTKAGDVRTFDQVIFAAHSDEALALLHDPSVQEEQVLGDIPYANNDIVMHTDVRLMPERKLAWAAWNYNLFDDLTDDVAVTYNMNILQGLTCPTQFLVSLNCEKHIDPGRIIKRLKYSHPVYTSRTVAAQARHSEISGVNRTHYCGAYWGNGFHEDGVVSALRVVKAIDPEVSL